MSNPVSPSHYKDYCDGMQWLETMQYLPDFKDPEKFKAAIKLQIRKYLDRDGQKDDTRQELRKALWYLKFLVAYLHNDGKPLMIVDVDTVLAELEK